MEFTEPKQWEGKDTPELMRDIAPYLEETRYEVVVMARKQWVFQCRGFEEWYGNQSYSHSPGWTKFIHVLINTSIMKGNKLETVRLSYHPFIYLVNTPLMIKPLPKEEKREEGINASPGPRGGL